MKNEVWVIENEAEGRNENVAPFEGSHRETLTDTHDNGLNEAGVGELMGSSTGEEDGEGDTVPGGWQGTDDATSTAPGDLGGGRDLKHTNAGHPDAAMGRGYAGGVGDFEGAGGVTDIKGSPAEESRDWEHEPIVEES